MKVRRLIVCMLVMISYILPAQADLTIEAKNFRTSIMQFLREEGFAPSVDDDGDIAFKKEGTAYWIRCEGSTPIYVTIFRENLGCTDANKQYVLQACNDTNKRVRCVKTVMKDTKIDFTIEMYCHVPEEFKYVFYKNIGALEYAYSVVKEIYQQLDQ